MVIRLIVTPALDHRERGLGWSTVIVVADDVVLLKEQVDDGDFVDKNLKLEGYNVSQTQVKRVATDPKQGQERMDEKRAGHPSNSEGSP